MAADVTVAPTLGHPILLTQGGVGASPGYDAIDLRRMIQAASGGQEGVYNSTGWKVSENGGGANMTVQVAANVGLARVDGESVTHQGPYIVSPHSAVITLDVATAHSTNPRIDMVILHVRDNTHDALGANDARVRILSGTATSGATLANLNGQASLPSNALKLADVLVPAADTTISNSQIADRRRWAFGAYRSLVKSNADISGVVSTNWIALDATTLMVTGEFSGAPVEVGISGGAAGAGAGSWNFLVGYSLDGDLIGAATTTARARIVTINGTFSQDITSFWRFTPAAGRHTLTPIVRLNSASATNIWASTANGGLEFYVRELVQPNSDNT